MRQYPGGRTGDPVDAVWRINGNGRCVCRADWQTGATGCPRLEAALVSFDCRIDQRVSVGTHDILFCHVVAITRHPEPRGLMWFDRGYHTLMRPAC